MKQTPLRLSRLSLGLMAALAAGSALAQSATTSGVGGFVTDASGAPIAGADVTVTNTATGAVSRATTSANGYYSVRGLQAGGPYTVTASKGGTTQSSEGVYVELNSVASVNERLGAETTDLGSVQVTGNRALLNTFNSDNKGTGTNISGRALETTPSANRSIDDIARLDPRIQVTDPGTGAISMAGINNRYNTISVDGLSQGDPFGLNANGMPYTGSPISTEAIAAYNIATTDYDTGSDTVGAAINAVTKSGTNEFHGEAYYGFKNASSMVGQVNGEDFTGFGSDKVWGVNVGGPIVKDKLFFFASYEQEKVTDISSGSDAYTSGSMPLADIERAEAIAAQYGIPSTYPASANMEDKRYLAKLDWNIADGHRASFTYQRTTEDKPTPYNNAPYSVILSSHWYNISSVTENYALSFNDDWTDTFSTEAKFSYQKFDQNAGSTVNSPSVLIYDGSDDIYLGEDPYRAVNQIGTKTFRGTIDGVWRLGNHVVKGGVDFMNEQMFDLFGSYLNGSYTFDSLDDFAAGTYYQYQVATVPPGVSLQSLGTPWTYRQYSPFVQDTWQATDTFSLIYGVRADIPDANHAPLYNANWERDFGYPNNNTLSSKNKVIEPRVGFNWQLGDGDQLLQLRGGVGLFQSTPPVVWLNNPYGNNGVASSITHIAYDGTAPSTLEPYPNAPVPTGPGSIPKYQVDTLSPDFKMPTVWKATLGLDAALPWWGLIGTVEYQHIKNKDAIVYYAPNIGTPNGVLPDGRDSYWTDYSGFAGGKLPSGANKNNGTNPAYTTNSTLLGNTDKGGSDSLTLALTKPMAYGFTGNLSVTATHANEVNQGSSSQASSNYAYVVRTNPNDAIASPADYVVPLAVKASLNWDHAFFGDYKTTVSLFYNGHKGTPYTWVFGGGTSDVNGDGVSYEDPAYIPLLNDSKVSYVDSQGNAASAAEIAAFQKFINSDSYLSTHRGQIASRNGSRLPWSNSLDLGLQQELPGFFHGNKFVVRLDVYDFLNLLNKKWGQQYYNGGYDTADFVPVYGIKDGQYQYNIADANSGKPTWTSSTVYYNNASYPQRTVSLWSAMLTLKYQF